MDEGKKQWLYRPKHARGKGEGRGRPLRSLLTCGLAVFLIVMGFHFCFGIAVVKGTSMQPELYAGDVVLFWKPQASYRRGDIVLVKTDGRDDLVKRVCALPGETVEIDEEKGALLVDGKALPESRIYRETHGKTAGRQTRVGENEYFVLGDNREDSRDSRDYGAVGKERIDGKALIVIRNY